MGTVDWTAYDDRCVLFFERVKGIFAGLAEEFNQEIQESFREDTGYEFSVERDDGNKLSVTLEIWDSGDADDGIFGVHGNPMLELCEYGGRVVGSFSPDNYTDQVWADYDDDERWECKTQAVEQCLFNMRAVIEGWIAEKA